MSASDPPPPRRRLRRGFAAAATLVALLYAAAAPAAAAQRSPAGPPTRPALAAAGSKPLVFMGLGTVAGLAVLATAGLITAAHRRYVNSHAMDRS
ncbi:hypothetical protein [Streptomyces bugieae]|uniref:Uncharacterized protein n=1 Tax=Streptomyces bugieae TaxID=3098223 RepID=A0ABU7NLX0_9ACTN|nr:hypothetical protein [Streptomyces sp. DSM 41528]